MPVDKFLDEAANQIPVIHVTECVTGKPGVALASAAELQSAIAWIETQEALAVITPDNKGTRARSARGQGQSQTTKA